MISAHVISAHLISAAAIAMVVAFGSFLLESGRAIERFDIGRAGAVLLDATVVRLLPVPATMELAGDSIWWLPRSWGGHREPAADVLASSRAGG